MTQSEVAQRKLARFREVQDRKKQLSKLRAQRIVALTRERQRMKSATYVREKRARAFLLRVQRNSCGACKRPFSGSGPGLKAYLDRTKSRLIRGYLCVRCNRLIAKYHDDPEELLKQCGQGVYSDATLKGAARYLKFWPSQRSGFPVL